MTLGSMFKGLDGVKLSLTLRELGILAVAVVWLGQQAGVIPQNAIPTDPRAMDTTSRDTFLRLARDAEETKDTVERQKKVLETLAEAQNTSAGTLRMLVEAMQSGHTRIENAIERHDDMMRRRP